jgi:N-methylhydantoinase A/oxoprolinase/acetone carboxylase beta subunit
VQLLGGAMSIDIERSGAAIDRIARRLKLDRIAAAAGILRVANANMERAIRVVSVERGYDPRDFALVAFGGSGGLHACEIARELGIRTVIVPEQAGALSALGMLAADARRDYAASALGGSDPQRLFESLERRARRESPHAEIERSADLRYRGQSYELNVPFSIDPIRNFHEEHKRIYGYATPEREVEVVTLRVQARERLPKPRLTRSPYRRGRIETRRVWVAGAWRTIPALARAQASPRRTAGPALILDYGSTTLIPPGWRYRNDDSGNLIATL